MSRSLARALVLGLIPSADTIRPRYMFSEFTKSHLETRILKPAVRKHRKTSHSHSM